MVRSMTGFGRGVTMTEQFQLTVEIRSVNHRFLEVSTKFPKEWVEAEIHTKKLLSSLLSRGKLDVFVHVKQNEQQAPKIKVNLPTLLAYKEAREEVNSILPLTKEWSMQEILAISDALIVESAETPNEVILQAVNIAVDEAAQSLISMREREGQQLYEVVKGFRAELMQHIEDIRQVSSQAVDKYRQKLLQRLQEFTTSEVIEDRLLTEIAVFAERVDIAEELDRLTSHFEQLAETLNETGPIGRKLDFLSQEIHREINTIGSKNQSSVASIAVVQAKSTLEKLREQVQNIE
ncbi:YicC family protein [Kurthia zopfii]|uniref:Large subunit ribosomal protein L28 n=3 Tax=Kurthia zopfii TaxID=1650 RepID=A0A2U3AE99_9BACL|nr:YicC/YloC family endoribonuclease [Kurthia zopfii]PWI22860.1 YicC family protein [Kurthia zopfii]TDR40176.1 large subunit ribosomal protein L28 [Kurthia zopfii]STX09024.1 YicC-like family, N-terminal region [Kurthia zopfii]VEI04762.1 YicC-like family, N-terminal region [Kurthia zopfii]